MKLNRLGVAVYSILVCALCLYCAAAISRFFLSYSWRWLGGLTAMAGLICLVGGLLLALNWRGLTERAQLRSVPSCWPVEEQRDCMSINRIVGAGWAVVGATFVVIGLVLLSGV